MDHFTTQPVWGLSTITAREQARFFLRIERFIPRRHRAYAMRLLNSIIHRQRWGIPPVAPRGWKLYFKGGLVGTAELARQPGDAAARSTAPVLGRDPDPRAALEGVRDPLDPGRRQAAPRRVQPGDSLNPLDRGESGGITGSWGRDPGSPGQMPRDRRHCRRPWRPFVFFPRSPRRRTQPSGHVHRPGPARCG